jgi:hypothetical protein
MGYLRGAAVDFVEPLGPPIAMQLHTTKALFIILCIDDTWLV